MHNLHFFLEMALEFDLFCVEGILYENGPCSTDLLAVVSGFVATLLKVLLNLVKMEPTECSETSAFNIQTPGKYPEESIP
jgi:hypothetical protein